MAPRTIFSTFRRWWRITKLIWKDELVRSWRKLENGEYICDGDCGVYKLHGVCTCGLSHMLKPYGGYRHEQHRGRDSWMREYQTEQIMMDVPWQHNCEHGKLLNDDDCDECDAASKKLLDVLLLELNNENPTTTL